MKMPREGWKVKAFPDKFPCGCPAFRKPTESRAPVIILKDRAVRVCQCGKIWRALWSLVRGS